MKPVDGFLRSDSNPGAVINTDNASLKAYKLQKNKHREIDQLKEEVSEIKGMLQLILERLK